MKRISILKDVESHALSGVSETAGNTAFEKWWYKWRMEGTCHLQTIDIAQRAYREALASIGHCNCSLTTKLLGEGCTVCNPTLKRELEAYNEGYAEALEEAAKVAESYSDPWSKPNGDSDGISEAIRRLK